MVAFIQPRTLTAPTGSCLRQCTEMDLLEYQAKELFQQVGIPTLPSQRIDQPKDVKGLKLPYPVVLKSQVSTGGRGKAGGIKFVENTIDAMAAAQSIFHLPIMGKFPEVLLAEAKYDTDREFYLAVVLDSSTHCPLLLGSQRGGVEIETVLESLQQVVVDQEFAPFYARRLALKMGLEGALIQSVSSIVEKMYRLFIQWDLDLVEINPLGVSPAGELMALDGKITVNDAALGRHASISSMMATMSDNVLRLQAPSRSNLIRMEGNIGLLCSGAGLLMSTLDLLHNAKGKPGVAIDLSSAPHSNSPATLPNRLQQHLESLVGDRRMKAILINLLGENQSCLALAEAIALVVKRQGAHRLPAIVVRSIGDQFTEAQQLLADLNIVLLDDLDTAIAKTVALAKTAAPK